MMEDIPFNCVRLMTWQNLANKLDPDSPLMGNNWKMLAEKLGYTTEQILCLESRHTSHGRNTLKLFEEYVKKADSTVQKLRKALDEMDRPDALQVLLDAMPDIEQTYQRELNSRRIKSDPDENSYGWPPSCQSSCSSSFINNRIPTPMTQPMAQHSSFHLPMSNHSYNSGMHITSYIPSISHMTMSGGTVRHIPVEKEMNIPQQNHSYCSQQINPSHFRAPQSHATSTQIQHPASTQVQHPTHSRIQNTNHSMVVHVDPQEVVADMRDVEMTELNIPVTENAAPLPLTIARGQGINVPRLMNPQEMLVGGEVTVGTSSPPQQQINRTLMTRLERQVSEECNSRQPSGLENCHSKKAVGLNLKCTKTQNAKPEGSNFISPGPTPTSMPSTPLGKLKQFTDSELYMPTEQYKTMMEEKLREEVLYNRAYNDEVHNRIRAEHQMNKKNGEIPNDDAFRQIFKFSKNSQMAAACNGRPQCSTTVKSNTEKEVPKTFPLRAKSTGSCVSENSQDRPSILPKSQSLPDDLKPAEYKRAFRHIKVFVTYSDDNKRHLQRVLNLCRCLEKNGFTCCMDMYGRKMQVTDKMGWLDQRFKEADFILVCVSPAYKNDVDNYEIDMATDFSDDVLHTKYIYKLIQSELLDNGQRNVRFVPVMFESTSKEHVPSCLENGLFYSWPGQYRDLLWFLTKPETRVKAKIMANLEENPPVSPDSSIKEDNL